MKKQLLMTLILLLFISTVTAIDVSDYTEYFIKDGHFDGKIVIGDSAPASDIISAVDIATDLQDNSISIESEVNDIMEEGETKTYAVNGQDYEIENIVITDSGVIYTQFKINGEITDKLKVGDVYTLVDGMNIEILTLLNNEAGDVTGDLVEFRMISQLVTVRPIEVGSLVLTSELEGFYEEHNLIVLGTFESNEFFDEMISNPGLFVNEAIIEIFDYDDNVIMYIIGGSDEMVEIASNVLISDDYDLDSNKLYIYYDDIKGDIIVDTKKNEVPVYIEVMPFMTLNNDHVLVGDDIKVSLRIENYEYFNEKNVLLKISIPELGIFSSTNIDLIQSDDFKWSDEVSLRIPEYIELGNYVLTFEVIYDNMITMSSIDIFVTDDKSRITTINTEVASSSFILDIDTVPEYANCNYYIVDETLDFVDFGNIYGGKNRIEKVTLDDIYDEVLVVLFCENVMYSGWSAKRLTINTDFSIEDIYDLEYDVSDMVRNDLYPFLENLEYSELTIIIPVDEYTVTSYEIEIDDGYIDVSYNDVLLYGDGAEYEHFIIEFEDFRAFEYLRDNPSINTIKEMVRNEKIIVDISKFIGSGGKLQNEFEFAHYYCDFVSEYLSEFEQIYLGLNGVCSVFNRTENELLLMNEFSLRQFSNIKEVRNAKVQNDNGKISWQTSLDLSTLKSYTGGIEIGKTFVELDSAKYPELNRQALITLPGGYDNPVVLRNGIACSQCDILNSNVENIQFMVSGFSRYDVVEESIVLIPNIEIPDLDVSDSKEAIIQRITFNDYIFNAGELLIVNVNIDDVNDNIDLAKVTLSILDLGIKTSAKLESNNLKLYLELPDDIDSGFYNVRLTLYDDGYKRVKNREIEII